MFNNIKIQGTQLNFGTEGSWTEENEYAYFNTFNFPSVTKGQNVSIELNVYSVEDIEPMYFALWIDYNHNNVFDNNELTMCNANTIQTALPAFEEPETPIMKTITIPLTAATGITRARLLRGNNPQAIFGPYDPTFVLSPCNSSANGNNSFGNTYDFNLQIIEGNLATSAISNSGASIHFYPNPAAETIRFVSETPQDFSVLNFQDVSGRIVKTVSVDNELTPISVSDLPEGVYYIFSSGESHSFFLERVIITH